MNVSNLHIRELKAVNLRSAGGWRNVAADYAKNLRTLNHNAPLKALVLSASMIAEPLFATDPLISSSIAAVNPGEDFPQGYPKLNFVESAVLTPKIVKDLYRTKGERPINMLVLDYCADNYSLEHSELKKYYAHGLGLGFLNTLCREYSKQFGLGYTLWMDNDWKAAGGLDNFCHEQDPAVKPFGNSDAWWTLWSTPSKNYKKDGMRFAFFVQISGMKDANISLSLDIKPSVNKMITAFERSLQSNDQSADWVPLLD